MELGAFRAVFWFIQICEGTSNCSSARLKKKKKNTAQDHLEPEHIKAWLTSWDTWQSTCHECATHAWTWRGRGNVTPRGSAEDSIADNRYVCSSPFSPTKTHGTGGQHQHKQDYVSAQSLNGLNLILIIKR